MSSECVPREVVIAAVEEYGAAWTTQDPGRIGNLFTKNSIYVERAFDKKATFRGRAAIEDYWRYQICGKQCNIRFRHVVSEMVRDADRPIAVVKWLAEFDNRREHRSGTAAHKRVRFCQVAKLIFDGSQISYLEEYAQGMGGSGVKWPGFDAPDEELWRCVRFDPLPPPPPVFCDRCQQRFPSRTKLFRHLKATSVPADGSLGCVPNESETDDEHVLVCFSLSYTNSSDPGVCLLSILREIFGVDRVTDMLVWAVPPNFVTSNTAVVNVVTTKLLKHSLEMHAVENLPPLLNAKLHDSSLHIHAAGVVSRPCSPERRELEKYVLYIPWEELRIAKETIVSHQLQRDDEVLIGLDDGNKTTQTSGIVRQWRKPIEETSAYQYIDAAVLRRLRQATRLIKENCEKLHLNEVADKMNDGSDGGSNVGSIQEKEKKKRLSQPIRARGGTLQEPWERICKLSISMRQPYAGCVDRLAGLIVSYATASNPMADGEFLDRLSTLTLSSTPPPSLPEPLCHNLILLEPALTRFENKMEIQLSSQNYQASKCLRRSIEDVHQVIQQEQVGSYRSRVL